MPRHVDLWDDLYAPHGGIVYDFPNVLLCVITAILLLAGSGAADFRGLNLQFRIVLRLGTSHADGVLIVEGAPRPVAR